MVDGDERPVEERPEPDAPDDAVAAQERNDDALPSLDTPLPTRRVWPLFVVLILLAAGGAAGAWHLMTEPLPLRVLIAVDVDGYWWEGSKPAAEVADALAAQLADMGFDPVRAGDPDTTQVLEDAPDPVAAARKLRAAFVIEAHVSPKVAELPVKDGFWELRLDSPLSVRHVDEPSPFASERMVGWAGGQTKEEAAGYVADSVTRQALDIALPALLEHPVIAGILAGQDPKLIDQLAPAKNFATARAAELERARAAYADLEAKRASNEKGPAPLAFVSPPAADDRLIATADDGVLVATANVTPYYTPRTMRLVRREGLETVEWRRDGGSSDVLWSGYNVFTSPSASRAGDRVAMIEDLYGWARSLAILGKGDEPRRVRIDAERKLSEPRMSPSGKRVALVDKACRSCERELRVLDVTGTTAKPLLFIGVDDYRGRLGEFAWLDDRTLMVDFRPALHRTPGGDTVQALWALDIDADKRFTLMVPEGGASLGSACASADGNQVAAANPAGGSVVVLDRKSNAVASYPVEGRAAALSFSSDGKRLVFERVQRGRYQEIVVLELDGGKLTALTNNDSPDRSPLFSPDGKRVYFEARNSDPVFGRKRAVVRIAWVPTP